MFDMYTCIKREIKILFLLHFLDAFYFLKFYFIYIYILYYYFEMSHKAVPAKYTSFFKILAVCKGSCVVGYSQQQLKEFISYQKNRSIISLLLRMEFIWIYCYCCWQ